MHWGLAAVSAVGLPHGRTGLLPVGGPVVGGAVVGPAVRLLLLLLGAAVRVAVPAVGPDSSPLLPAPLRRVRLRARRREADGLRLPPGPPRRLLLRLLEGVLGDVEGLRVHRVVELLLLEEMMHWLLLHWLLLLHPAQLTRLLLVGL